MLSFHAATMSGDKKPTIACGDSGFSKLAQTSTHRLPPKQQTQQSREQVKAAIHNEVTFSNSQAIRQAVDCDGCYCGPNSNMIMRRRSLMVRPVSGQTYIHLDCRTGFFDGSKGRVTT
jgi:hypothetical protein